MMIREIMDSLEKSHGKKALVFGIKGFLFGLIMGVVLMAPFAMKI
tara:strand:- start:461 stop:595 length:135 start_codon:yes stop_codon:yes gene_type:complete